MKKQIVIIFIRSKKGDFFVHQRLSTKKTFPNRFGIGAGGHVEDGEDTAVAAQRELKEETGVTTPVRFLFSMNFDTTALQQTNHLFVTQSEELIVNDSSEWQWSGWMKKQEIEKLLLENKLCDDTAEIYKKYIAEFEGKNI